MKTSGKFRLGGIFSFITITAIMIIGVFALIGCDDSTETSGSDSLRTLPGTVTVSGNRFVGQTLTAQYSGDIPITYQWNRWGSALNNATNQEYTLIVTGAYSVTVSAEGYKPLTSLVFRVTASPNSDEDDDEEPVLTNIASVKQRLADDTRGGGADSPIPLVLAINLAEEEEVSGWHSILETIEEAEKYIDLDLSACDIDGTAFNPSLASEFGGEYIVSITLPNAAEIIVGDKGFYGVTNTPAYNLSLFFKNLKSIRGDGITSITRSTFANHPSLESVYFPAVTIIDQYAFQLCRSLISASFPAVTEIKSDAFSLCTDLTEISFPAAADISPGAFQGCTSLTFNLIGTGSLSVLEDGRALVRDNTELAAYPSASDHVQMDTITKIGESAFHSASLLTSVSFPAVTEIAERAFYAATYLEQVDFPIAAEIKGQAFMFCRDALIEADFPEVSFIGERAFNSCYELIKASFPKATIISQNAFQMSQKLAEVTLGTIDQNDFHTDWSTGQLGNLRTVYLAAEGGPGTYTRVDTTWTKQP